MYWRESANIAEKLGWRVINPNLPGFAGSDPLPWQRVTIGEISDQVVRLLDNLEVERAVLLGHSMGGAVAVRIADVHPERVLGIIYRDGAATPEWKNRHGAIVAVLSPLLPGAANLIDLTLSVVFDSPDLLIGRRLSSTMRGLWPDAQQNLRAFYRIMPVGSMLMRLDMREEVGAFGGNGIPILAEWGCFDRVVTARTRQEFCDLTGTQVVWVPGGHSWMLPRPQRASRHLEAPACRAGFRRPCGRPPPCKLCGRVSESVLPVLPRSCQLAAQLYRWLPAAVESRRGRADRHLSPADSG